MRKRVGLDDVTAVARRASLRVRLARFGVKADVGLHTEEVSRPQELPVQSRGLEMGHISSLAHGWLIG